MLMFMVLPAIFVLVVNLLGYICLSLVIFCGCLRVLGVIFLWFTMKVVVFLSLNIVVVIISMADCVFGNISVVDYCV